MLIEAFASATPIVDGWRASAVDDGRAAVLVPPADLDALVAGIHRLAEDFELQAACVERGLELVRNLTLEAQAERVARFIRSCAGGGPSTR